jgi:hypothetical protein
MQTQNNSYHNFKKVFQNNNDWNGFSMAAPSFKSAPKAPKTTMTQFNHAGQNGYDKNASKGAELFLDFLGFGALNAVSNVLDVAGLDEMADLTNTLHHTHSLEVVDEIYTDRMEAKLAMDAKKNHNFKPVLSAVEGGKSSKNSFSNVCEPYDYSKQIKPHLALQPAPMPVMPFQRKFAA